LGQLERNCGDWRSELFPETLNDLENIDISPKIADGIFEERFRFRTEKPLMFGC
jgi:hypothetical protein